MVSYLWLTYKALVSPHHLGLIELIILASTQTKTCICVKVLQSYYYDILSMIHL